VLVFICVLPFGFRATFCSCSGFRSKKHKPDFLWRREWYKSIVGSLLIHFWPLEEDQPGHQEARQTLPVTSRRRHCRSPSLTVDESCCKGLCALPGIKKSLFGIIMDSRRVKFIKLGTRTIKSIDGTSGDEKQTCDISCQSDDLIFRNRQPGSPN
jgi:hypothetical protein